MQGIAEEGLPGQRRLTTRGRSAGWLWSLEDGRPVATAGTSSQNCRRHRRPNIAVHEYQLDTTRPLDELPTAPALTLGR